MSTAWSAALVCVFWHAVRISCSSYSWKLIAIGKPGQKSSQADSICDASQRFAKVCMLLLIAEGSGTAAAYKRVDEAGLCTNIKPPVVPVANGQLQNLLPC